MRYIYLFFLFAVSFSFARELKIAHVDSKIIFDSYEGTSLAQEDYNRQVAKWEKKAARLQKSIKEMKEKLEKQSLLLSSKKKKKLEKNIEEQEKEFQTFVQKIYGREGELVKKNEEFSAPIIKKIKELIQEISSAEGYDMVLDRASGSVVFWKANNDLTQKVIDKLNKE